MGRVREQRRRAANSRRLPLQCRAETLILVTEPRFRQWNSRTQAAVAHYPRCRRSQAANSSVAPLQTFMTPNAWARSPPRKPPALRKVAPANASHFPNWSFPRRPSRAEHGGTDFGIGDTVPTCILWTLRHLLFILWSTDYWSHICCGRLIASYPRTQGPFGRQNWLTHASFLAGLPLPAGKRYPLRARTTSIAE